MADRWQSIERRARKKGKYVETLWLRKGQTVAEKATGQIGIVDRVISNLRYMVSFGGAVVARKGSQLELPRDMR